MIFFPRVAWLLFAPWFGPRTRGRLEALVRDRGRRIAVGFRRNVAGSMRPPTPSPEYLTTGLSSGNRRLAGGGAFGLGMREGILAAFNEANAAGGVSVSSNLPL